MSNDKNHLPPVYFNHLYVVLDDKSYRAIQGSDFLRIAFPGVERRATRTAAGETWSGTYFYCQDTYIELFGSGNGPMTGTATHGGHWQMGAQEGWGGLAFSVDKPGASLKIRQALQNHYDYPPFHELRQTILDGQAVNWFYNLKLAERLGMGSFDSWIMEYHPDIFAWKGIQVNTNGSLTRQAYLSAWNQTKQAVGSSSSPPSHSHPTKTDTNSAREKTVDSTLASEHSPVFSGVTGATIHMDARRAERYADLLTFLGYAQSTTTEGILLNGHGFTLNIQPEESAPPGYRLSSLRLRMGRPSVAPMTFIFAPRSRLELRDDLTAEWFFGV